MRRLLVCFCGVFFTALTLALAQDQVRTVAAVSGWPARCEATRLLKVGNRLLIGTTGHGLWSMEKGGASPIQISEMTPKTEITAFGHVPGRTMIGTVNTDNMNPYESSSVGIWSLPDGGSKLLQITGMPENACAQVFFPLGDETLIATYGHGLWMVPDDSLKAIRVEGPPDKDPIQRIFLDGQRAIVPTYYHGIWSVSPGQTSAAPLVDPSQNKDVAAPLSFARLGDTVLIGMSTGGLWRVHDGSTKAQRVEGIPDEDYVRKMIADKNRLILGAGSGLYVLTKGSDKPTKLKDFSAYNGVLDLARMGSAIYAGTYNNGVWRLDDGESAVEQVPSVPDDANVHDFTLADGFLVCGYSNFLSSQTGDDIGLEGLPSGRDIFDIVYFDGRLFYACHQGLFSVAL